MYLLIVFLPLLGALFSGFFSFLLGRVGASFLTCFSIFLTFICVCFTFYEVAFMGSSCYVTFIT
tara:strand:+ start:309 stop:500 length:192 start_codon:yes stop_codon:yes gene_type:complete